MTDRTQIQKELINELLLRSKRRCAACFAFEADASPRPGSFAHIRPLSGSDEPTIDNLVYLCAKHHEEFDRGSKGLTADEIIEARRVLYEAMDRAEATPTPQRSQVFVVHGHNHERAHEVMSFLQRLGLDTVSLTQQPSFGHSMLETIERHADVPFAVAILGPDDQVQPRSRVRQNVLLELGYFLGRLGRSRVCVLVEPGVEIPSDILGILYVQLGESDDWKYELSRSVQSAGVLVDDRTVLHK